METITGMSFYKTAKFKKLQTKWYKKLEKEGFEDAENESNGKTFLKVWHSSYFQTKYTKDAFQSKAAYYRMAAQFLHRHAFENQLEQAIWLLHSEGLSLRDIAVEVCSNKDTVNQVVRRLAKIMRTSISER